MKSVAELASRARAINDRKWTNILRQAHNNLVEALDALSRSATDENLKEVNGAWAYARRMYDACPLDIVIHMDKADNGHVIT